MKKIYFIILCFCTQVCFAQNLVPNPSFEDTIAHNGICIGPISYSKGWFNPNAATTDFYTYIPQSTNCMISSCNNQNVPLQVELGCNKNKIIYLSQNFPNPFNDNTQISFNIPQDVKSASIMFSDNNGNVIKAIEITSRGQNSIMVFVENLSKGIYCYTLIVDGKVADSKRMVKQ